MPPSSRKRNKGKERKAKQLAKKEENDRADAHQCWQSFYSSRFWSTTIDCDHGCDVAISDNHPVSIFMDHFILNLELEGMWSAHRIMTNLFETHRLIWNNESYRRLALNILIRMGTNMLLREEECEISWPVGIAHCIFILELYNGTGSIHPVLNDPVLLAKRTELSVTSSIRRDVLKFYRKRTTCKCLKKMHLEARKTIPKMGFCWGCDKEMERVALSVCGRCMVQQYCSRECQVSHWSSHEALCNTTRKQVRARTDI